MPVNNHSSSDQPQAEVIEEWSEQCPGAVEAIAEFCRVNAELEAAVAVACEYKIEKLDRQIEQRWQQLLSHQPSSVRDAKMLIQFLLLQIATLGAESHKFEQIKSRTTDLFEQYCR